ncbi:hypothetical protein C8D87_1021098 [Lentzea atacamensis]|uniref:Uncharacterized protein n=1 Tax=Lentzea atacamensis TaxID=531938 RepID=A0ABX9EI20_9PSEU|nr:hypothetical protein [Lentzea atacamensis]RAS69020.1 hypothetical protein C8D87_1021098 [Lentzea atacamensis]
MRRKLLATALLVLFGCHPVANAGPEVVISESCEASDVVDQPLFSAIPGDSVVLTLHTRVRVDNSKNRKGSGMLTTGFTTHKVTAAYGLKWQS